ncbi:MULTISPECIES: F0F1 ATP synthase subunit gamma [Thalassoglobus]|uniref:ATP synthase gamma chain n=1 Tax=Thalassoglobus polymorphus TaxID=2527994 RepID=A0A517QK05_9PLAN|nr:F0F1 ATP synthase subunit gamma [Thalassoglobus polymorphus]QDT31972.1 ATP synthase gamma chain [Thalassoglobus polymorphus]
MQTLDTLKRQIKNVEDLSSVVRTMKTLAAVSIRQYELAVESLAGYYGTIEDGLRILLWNQATAPEIDKHRTNPRTGVVIFGSDQGMCGQFNEQIVNFTTDVMAERLQQKKEKWSFMAVGARVASRLEEHGYTVDRVFPVAGSASEITTIVQDLLQGIDHWRSEAKLGSVQLLYNQRQSASSYQPFQFELLPIGPEKFQKMRQKRWESRTLPRYTMDQRQLFSQLIQQYIFVCLFRASAESLAGENASRIASMQAAERNIKDRLSELRMSYQQTRQTSITEELLDVVTGFEALSDS